LAALKLVTASFKYDVDGLKVLFIGFLLKVPVPEWSYVNAFD